MNLPRHARYDVVNDSNTRKQWNPAYRLLGREEAEPQQWQLEAFDRKPVPPPSHTELALMKEDWTWTCTTKNKWHLASQGGAGELACRMQKRHYVLKPGPDGTVSATEQGTMQLLARASADDLCGQCLKKQAGVADWVERYR